MKYFKLVLVLLVLLTISCGQQKRYLYYKIKKGETLKSIAKKWNVNIATLRLLNPQIDDSIKENTSIFIPRRAKQNNTTIKDTVVTDLPTSDTFDLKALQKKFILHKVKKKETIYSLKRFYDVSEEALYALNPNLKTEGLKSNTYIKIKPILENAYEDSLATVARIYHDTVARVSSIKLTILLPFKADVYDSVVAVDIFRRNPLANMVTDFYLGSKIAIDSIKKQGIPVTVQLFDTGKRNTKIKTIIEDNELNDNDVIIGPFYFEEAKILAKKTKIPIVFPHFSKEQQYFSSSKLIKTAPEEQDYQNKLCSYLLEKYTDENIIIVGDKEATPKINQIITSFEELDSEINIVVLSPEEGYIKKRRFTAALSHKRKNWVLLITDKSAVVTDAIANLIALPKKITLQTFTLKKGKAFDKIDNNFLARIGFTYITNTFTENGDFASEAFNKKYMTENGALPSNYAIRGFDITYDILARLASAEKLKTTFKRGVSYRLASKFDYHQNPTQNEGLFIVKYGPNLTLRRLK